MSHDLCSPLETPRYASLGFWQLQKYYPELDSVPLCILDWCKQLRISLTRQSLDH